MRYCPSFNHKRCPLGITERYFTTSLALYGKPNVLDSFEQLYTLEDGLQYRVLGRCWATYDRLPTQLNV